MIQVDVGDLDRLTEASYRILRGEKPPLLELPPEYPANEFRQFVEYFNRLIGEYTLFADFMYAMARGDLDYEPLAAGPLSADAAEPAEPAAAAAAAAEEERPPSPVLCRMHVRDDRCKRHFIENNGTQWPDDQKPECPLCLEEYEDA